MDGIEAIRELPKLRQLANELALELSMERVKNEKLVGLLREKELEAEALSEYKWMYEELCGGVR